MPTVTIASTWSRPPSGCAKAVNEAVPVADAGMRQGGGRHERDGGGERAGQTTVHGGFLLRGVRASSKNCISSTQMPGKSALQQRSCRAVRFPWPGPVVERLADFILLLTNYFPIGIWIIPAHDGVSGTVHDGAGSSRLRLVTAVRSTEPLAGHWYKEKSKDPFSSLAADARESCSKACRAGWRSELRWHVSSGRNESGPSAWRQCRGILPRVSRDGSNFTGMYRTSAQ